MPAFFNPTAFGGGRTALLPPVCSFPLRLHAWLASGHLVVSLYVSRTLFLDQAPAFPAPPPDGSGPPAAAPPPAASIDDDDLMVFNRKKKPKHPDDG
jgi:hypothetical protein